MPIHIFTEAERARLAAFPEEITHDDLLTFFTLSEADREQLPFFSAPHNRLGFALQLCTLRFMGFVPEALTHIPPGVASTSGSCSCYRFAPGAHIALLLSFL